MKKHHGHTPGNEDRIDDVRKALEQTRKEIQVALEGIHVRKARIEDAHLRVETAPPEKLDILEQELTGLTLDLGRWEHTLRKLEERLNLLQEWNEHGDSASKNE